MRASSSRPMLRALRALPLVRRQRRADPLVPPEYFPMRIDAQRNCMFFVEMSKDSFQRSVFLDHRAVRSGSGTLLASIPKLSGIRAQTPLYVILHGAFCGSTLLARYFERLPRCLVLKEPNLLGQLATMENTAATVWDAWFDVALTMLVRNFTNDVAVVVKAPDMSNWMGNAILDRSPRTKIIFLHSSLKTFLLQSLKDKDRRIWLREHLTYLSQGFSGVPFLPDRANPHWTDGQCAAAMWLLNTYLCNTLLARPDSHRVLPMNGDAVISQPQASFLAAADFFGVLNNKNNRSALKHMPPITTHSKDATLAYDASLRATDIAKAERQHASEIEAAMSWAREVASAWLPASPFPVENAGSGNGPGQANCATSRGHIHVKPARLLRVMA